VKLPSGRKTLIVSRMSQVCYDAGRVGLEAPKEMKMKRFLSRTLMNASVLMGLVVPLSSQMSRPRPLVLPLECPGGDCPLLEGVPQTSGMRSGFVRLQPGKTVGWHTTGQNEEALVILRGAGAALIEGHPARTFNAPAIAYIPSGTRHNVSNTGKQLLEYVYVVAPAATPK
jgi:mannose-6-phosphate isomerase-like protein (cupin superfamily)